MKDKHEVIQEFKELVNMTAKELKEWLKGDDSTSAGWPKDDTNGESVGHDSGRQIVEILESNPEKDPEKYTDEHISHMRKVVAYCKRHLAQEEKANNKKPIEEVKKTKSYASLKNWGHDPIKKREAKGSDAEIDAEGEEQEEDNAKEEQVGEKRKAPDDQSGESKKRETEDGAAAVKGDDEKDEPAEAEEEAASEKESEKEEENGNGDKAKGLEKGDTVSWKWGKGQPEGTVKEVNPEETTIETKRGNQVTRKGTEEDPAVVIDTGKSEAIKLSHELNETKE